MSMQAMQAVWDAPADVIDDPVKRLICLSLADYCGERWLAWASISTLAKRCNVSPRTVQRHVQALRDAGILRCLEVEKMADAERAEYPELVAYLALRANRRPTLYQLSARALRGDSVTPRNGGTPPRGDNVTPQTPVRGDNVTPQAGLGVTQTTPRGDTDDTPGAFRGDTGVTRSQLRDPKDPNLRAPARDAPARAREAPGFSPGGDAGPAPPLTPEPDRPAAGIPDAVRAANAANERAAMERLAAAAEARGDLHGAEVLRRGLS